MMRAATELVIAGVVLATLQRHASRNHATGAARVTYTAAGALVLDRSADAQGEAPTTTRPFAVGERAVYDVRVGIIRAGTGSMELLGIDTVRGRSAYRFLFAVNGGVPFYRVSDTLQSWVDVERFNSLRFVQDQEEGGRTRQKHYEIFPDRAEYEERTRPNSPPRPSVPNPLDDASFLYFIRTQDLEIGRTYDYPRYFKPESNPVRVKVLRRERIEVPAGRFNTIVLQPIIKTTGLFGEGGRAEVWVADDSTRIIVRINSKLPLVGTLDLRLRSYRSNTLSPPGRTP
jgi:hypothetical protein